MDNSQNEGTSLHTASFETLPVFNPPKNIKLLAKEPGVAQDISKAYRWKQHMSESEHHEKNAFKYKLFIFKA